MDVYNEFSETMARKTKIDAQITREKLLDTAEAFFCQKGVSGTSLDEIACAAGMTRGALYWHFDNKSDLFGALCERATTPMRAMLDRLAQEPGKTPLESLKAETLYMLTHLAEDRSLQSVFEVLLLRGDSGGELADVIAREEKNSAECRARLENILQAAIRTGELPRQIDTQMAAIALKSFICGLMRQWLQTRDFDLAKLAPAMLDIFFAGLVQSRLKS